MKKKKPSLFLMADYCNFYAWTGMGVIFNSRCAL